MGILHCHRMIDIITIMFTRVLISLTLFCCLSAIAQAGVMKSTDWDSVSVAGEIPQNEGPVRLEQGVPQSMMGDAAASQSSLTSAVYTVPQAFVLVPSLVGYLLHCDCALPPSPVLDGLIKPS
ncbi:MAG: hypothetical protein R3C53_27315 [Pirellulaceae bacterium]